MKKLLKKLITLTVTLVISASVFTGCVKPRTPNTETDLEIIYWDSGAGSEFMYKIIQAFNVKYPQINVIFTPTAEVQNMTLYTEPSSNTIDLYFTTMEEYLAYSNLLEPLNNIYESDVDGNGVTIGEKLDPNAVQILRSEDGNYYTVPWSHSINGIVYNQTVFEKEGFKLPRTTSELINLALTINTTKIGSSSKTYTPFIHFPEYWRYVYEVWMAQYDGVDAYFDKWTATYTDAEGARFADDVRAMTQMDGMYGAYEELYQILSPKGYVYNGSNSLSHTNSQTRFLAGEALMMPNGSWVENEMRNEDYNISIKLMKNPVNSNLAVKLGITDRTLSLLVALADGDALTPTEQNLINDVPESIRKEVADARNIYYTELPQFHTIIPNYSVAKEAAKDFLRFFYSDEAIKIAMQTTKTPSPARLSQGEVSTAGWSDFAKNNLELIQGSTFIFKALTTKLFYDGGIIQLVNQSPARAFTYGYDQQNVSTYWSSEVNYWQENWSVFKHNAGLN